ncbi:MAG: hypothetical protein ACF8LK_00245 [Phycisphaerales bacterium JB041]
MDSLAVHLAEPQHDRRTRVADFIHAHREAIKESFRARIASDDHRLYDSSDFFSTVQRRADQFVSLDGSPAARDIARILHDIMLEALSDYARATVRDHNVRESLTREAHASRDNMVVQPPEPAERRRLDALRLNPDELQLVRFRANGLLHRQVAAAFGVSAAVIRTRWLRLVGKAVEARSDTNG